MTLWLTHDIMIYYIILHHIVSYDIILYHIISYYYIILYHIISTCIDAVDTMRFSTGLFDCFFTCALRSQMPACSNHSAYAWAPAAPVMTGTIRYHQIWAEKTIENPRSRTVSCPFPLWTLTMMEMKSPPTQSGTRRGGSMGKWHWIE